MRVLIIEPFFTGSHAKWAKGFQAHSTHEVDILKLSGHYWKWRMHGGAVTLARKFMQLDYVPDLIIASDMLDLTTFQALTKTKSTSIPFVLYCHENQLLYPWSLDDEDVHRKRDNHYSFINYTSALAADEVWFNSDFHRQGFIAALEPFLKSFPDHNEVATIAEIKAKSKTLVLGVELAKFDDYKINKRNEKPLILWNHRWEHDKNPVAFFELLYKLMGEGHDFEVAILGQAYERIPDAFKIAKEKLGDRIIHFGFAESFETYAKWLWKADIIPVTSNQDFFGISTVEAIYCHAYPLLPNRLAFPMHLPESLHQQHLYDTDEELYQRMKRLLSGNKEFKLDEKAVELVKGYDWSRLIATYDSGINSFF